MCLKESFNTRMSVFTFLHETWRLLEAAENSTWQSKEYNYHRPPSAPSDMQFAQQSDRRHARLVSSAVVTHPGLTVSGMQEVSSYTGQA
jgi:hypothetical protein